MALSKSHKNTYPLPPLECELVEVDVASVPMMLTALRQRAWKNNWLTPDDQVRGRWAMNRAGARLLMGCSDKIVAAIDRLYMLHDGYYNMRRYTATGGVDGEPLVIDPPIPPAPVLEGDLLQGAHAIGHSLYHGMQNLANGYTNSYWGYEDIRNFRQQLEDLLAAYQAASPEQQLELQRLILITLGGVPPV